MKKSLLTLAVLFSALITACTEMKAAPVGQNEFVAEATSSQLEAKKKEKGLSCHVKKDMGRAEEPYSIMFPKGMKLIPIKSNSNYYIRLQADRKFGCVIFSKEPTLKGVYDSAQIERLNSTCEGRKDYEYTQFVNEDGKPVFRLQCDYPVYEDQLPKPFSPKLKDVKAINFVEASGDKSVKVIKTSVFEN